MDSRVTVEDVVPMAQVDMVPTDQEDMAPMMQSDTVQTVQADMVPMTQADSAPMAGVEMVTIGQVFEQCIQQVSRLQAQREELVQELQQLQNPVPQTENTQWTTLQTAEVYRQELQTEQPEKLQTANMQAIMALRAQREEARRLLKGVELQCNGFQEEVQRVKRKLFITARHCIQCQVTLTEQQYLVAQSTVTQEELQSDLLVLKEQLGELQKAYQNQLSALTDRIGTSQRPRANSDISHCRRSSLSLQRRLTGSMRALEGLYEPRLKALLRWSRAGEEALRRGRELSTNLKANLEPLGCELRQLELQRACLEERIALMETQRREDRAQYQEVVETLEESLRELKLEFNIQERAKKEMEELTETLMRELEFHRGYKAESETADEEDMT